MVAVSDRDSAARCPYRRLHCHSCRTDSSTVGRLVLAVKAVARESDRVRLGQARCHWGRSRRLGDQAYSGPLERTDRIRTIPQKVDVVPRQTERPVADRIDRQERDRIGLGQPRSLEGLFDGFELDALNFVRAECQNADEYAPIQR